MKNYIDFSNDVNIMKGRHPEMRLGQAMMNVLFDYDRVLYEEITGSQCDCFYDDKKISGFITKVFHKWGTIDYCP